jgi:hypothetical protein
MIVELTQSGGPEVTTLYHKPLKGSVIPKCLCAYQFCSDNTYIHIGSFMLIVCINICWYLLFQNYTLIIYISVG